MKWVMTWNYFLSTCSILSCSESNINFLPDLSELHTMTKGTKVNATSCRSQSRDIFREKLLRLLGHILDPPLTLLLGV
jgi:hypothetical protein